MFVFENMLFSHGYSVVNSSSDQCMPQYSTQPRSNRNGMPTVVRGSGEQLLYFGTANQCSESSTLPINHVKNRAQRSSDALRAPRNEDDKWQMTHSYRRNSSFQHCFVWDQHPVGQGECNPKRFTTRGNTHRQLLRIVT